MANTISSSRLDTYTPPDGRAGSLWILRIAPCLGLLFFALSLALSDYGFLRGICTGIAAGTMVVTITVAFTLDSVTLKKPTDAGLGLTRSR